MALEFLSGSIRRTVHRGGDDLLSAGLGLAGLASAPVAFAEPARPTPAELRRRAIQIGWKGIADLGPLGGYGGVYGAVPDVPGREYSAFAHLAHASQPHRVLCQVPDAFDRNARCLVVAPASGSRGIYGAMALAGAWGLARGCAVACTDKGAGTGYFDCADGSGIALDGTRVEAGSQSLDFEPEAVAQDAGIAVKHAHSGDHPEADWGRHVLQAVRFGLAMLDEAFPEQAPFTRGNTRILAVGTSNGGAAVLQAAGADVDGWLDGVVALEPNVQSPHSDRVLYDYASEAALWMPAALTHARFADVPFARIDGASNPLWLARGESLRAHGLIDGATAPAEAALEHLRAGGWRDNVLATSALSVTFDLWRAVAATYASAYLRADVGKTPCGFSFQPADVPGVPADAARATWWSDGTGIPPHPGIGLVGGLDASSDPTLPGVLALRALWDGDVATTPALHAAVDALTAALPRDDLPIWVVHGADDGLIPAAFTSDPYIAWLREQGRAPRYWCVPHAQHFDAFLQLPVPDFGARYVPLLPYGYHALDRMYAHVVNGEPLPDESTPQPRPRGAGALDRAMLDLPD